MNNYQAGYFAEFLARSYMRLHGYKILLKNYSIGKGSQAGEVDFVAEKNHMVVFVEVKKRKDIDSAAHAISERQKQRTRRGAEAFLQHYPKYQNHDIRFDAILVEFPLNIVHLEDAF